MYAPMILAPSVMPEVYQSVYVGLALFEVVGVPLMLGGHFPLNIFHKDGPGAYQQIGVLKAGYDPSGQLVSGQDYNFVARKEQKEGCRWEVELDLQGIGVNRSGAFDVSAQLAASAAAPGSLGGGFPQRWVLGFADRVGRRVRLDVEG